MKSFFQEAKLNEDGDIIGFKMHDLIHDLAKQVAGDDCCYLDNNAKGFRGRPVHVWVEFDSFYLLESLDASRLRTLIVLSFNDDELLDREKQSIISTFKHLRVLKLCNFEDVRLCVSFEKLKHLRFLDLLKSCMLESLHKSIGNLICLQTIKVRLNEKVVLSTKFVSKLINLRHLDIRTWTFGDKTPVGKFFGWLSPVTHIIEITLTYCQGLQYLPPLERLPFLKSLELCDLDDLEYIYCEESFSFRVSGVSATLLLASQLPISGGFVFGDYGKTFRTFHKPHDDFIKGNLTIFHQLVYYSYRRKNIKFFLVQNLTSLENLEFVYFSSQHFQATEIWFKDDINYLPSLQKITFHYCDDLKALPDWICNISSLQHIKIDYCNKLTLLPERMSRLTNLHTLEIFGDSLLVEECQKKHVQLGLKLLTSQT
ncbi:unnamed protein product [Trifolium pratense]|uniref:Uncharacterized protein n=1 Tax=Trifolium pratense TaxID=57577 RepID=A0ACB0L3M5_TRIPR|nr:unnamed protein product [Trifolium pratense]